MIKKNQLDMNGFKSIFYLSIIFIFFGGLIFFNDVHQLQVPVKNQLKVNNGVIGYKYSPGLSGSSSPYIRTKENEKIPFICAGSDKFDALDCRLGNFRKYLGKEARLWWFEFCGYKYMMQLEIEGVRVAEYSMYVKILNGITVRC